eukprot:4078812-Pyramimonas_sp.AAC.1
MSCHLKQREPSSRLERNNTYEHERRARSRYAAAHRQTPAMSLKSCHLKQREPSPRLERNNNYEQERRARSKFVLHGIPLAANCAFKAGDCNLSLEPKWLRRHPP